MEDGIDVSFRIAAGREKSGESLERGHALEVFRSLFITKTAVEVRADSDVRGVARELAKVVRVLNQFT